MSNPPITVVVDITKTIPGTIDNLTLIVDANVHVDVLRPIPPTTPPSDNGHSK